MWFVSKQTADFERESNKLETTKKSITLTYKKTLPCWRFPLASLPMAGDGRLVVTFVFDHRGRLSYMPVHV